MPSNEFEQRLNEIGQLLAEDTEYPLDGTLLYAIVDRTMVGPSIFKDRGSHILYRWPDLNRLSRALLDLWNVERPDKPWAEIEYVIRNGRFDVSFTYPEELDPNEDPGDRRDRIVKKHFGEKPIIYPPWPPDDDCDYFDL